MIKKTYWSLEVLTLFIWSFFVAIVDVALWIFRPNKRLHPVIVKYPTVLENRTALWVLSLIIFLTPGSLVVDFSADGKVLYIHFFHAENAEGEIEILRTRFENRLYRIFSHEGRQ